MLIEVDDNTLAVQKGEISVESAAFHEWCLSINMHTAELRVSATAADLDENERELVIAITELSDVFDVPCTITVAPSCAPLIHQLPLAADFVTVRISD
ncbi:hypothetical protein [Nocardia suismassiliense]|uniref:hypothetical protein n=1 Tax=Nocardia suismassiliense TaxID=2077092 RepID=UPI000D1F51F4|nr:hypothetical protein [Nocardia suismassiliense]